MQTILDQRDDFKGMREDLAYGLGSGADLADVAVVLDLLRGKDVLNVEHLIRLQTPCQFHRVHSAQVRVHVVQEFGTKTCLIA